MLRPAQFSQLSFPALALLHQEFVDSEPSRLVTNPLEIVLRQMSEGGVLYGREPIVAPTTEQGADNSRVVVVVDIWLGKRLSADLTQALLCGDHRVKVFWSHSVDSQTTLEHSLRFQSGHQECCVVTRSAPGHVAVKAGAGAIKVRSRLDDTASGAPFLWDVRLRQECYFGLTPLVQVSVALPAKSSDTKSVAWIGLELAERFAGLAPRTDFHSGSLYRGN